MPAERPGERCNIGEAEIDRRRRVAIVLSIATVALAAALLAAHEPLWTRLALWPFASGVAVTWLQVIRRFCVRFGAMGVENLDVLGSETPVNEAVRAADARRALAMIVEGVLVGTAVTIALLALPA